MKNEEITLRKDMKRKLSKKMIGETKEQHCENEFNKIRATAFQKAYYEKDNDSKTGNKGDLIHKETKDEENEEDETSSKNRNEDFLKELKNIV